jgi:hypothetical protein
MPLKLVHTKFAPRYVLTKDGSFSVALGTRESQYLVFHVTYLFCFKIKSNKVPVIIMIA